MQTMPITNSTTAAATVPSPIPAMILHARSHASDKHTRTRTKRKHKHESRTKHAGRTLRTLPQITAKVKHCRQAHRVIKQVFDDDNNDNPTLW